MGKIVFNAEETQFIKEIVEEATLNTLKAFKKEEKEKNKYDRRLRNTELLLKNYRNLKEHMKNAVFTNTEIENENVDEEFDFEDNEEIYISSIKRTRKRTEIIVKHINNCMEYYTYKCLNSTREEVQRRVQVIKMLYINDVQMSYSEIAEELGNISTKTVDRARKSAIPELAALFFGIDGLKLK
ncbi:MAG: helix-turn-helix domain-containing protein [Clostridia bacterium]|nr:helix-turn-helix domain-containing protein [Clostridia bacterium]